MNDLFPPAFLAAIEPLSLSVSRAPRAPQPGAHLSPLVGNSLDFRDFSNYTPGDDLRRVDWNVYRRTGHLFVRRFDHPTTTPIYVLLDVSESMFVESPSRYAAAARVAAAVSAAALREHDGVTLIPYAQHPGDPLTRLVGRRRLPEVLDFLSRQQSGGAGSVAAGVSALRDLARRSGIVVVISDCFEEAGVGALVDALRTIQHRLFVVQITQPFDADPTMGEDLELVDCESARTTIVHPSREMIAQYKQAYAAYQAELDRFVVARSAQLIKVDAAGDPIAQISPLFPAGILHVGGRP